VENHVCLSRGVQLAGASSDENRDRSKRSSAEGQGWSSINRILSGWAIKRSGDVVCDLHRAQGDDERRFFG
jgi:hypothetical protein